MAVKTSQWSTLTREHAQRAVEQWQKNVMRNLMIDFEMNQRPGCLGKGGPPKRLIGVKSRDVEAPVLPDLFLFQYVSNTSFSRAKRYWDEVKPWDAGYSHAFTAFHCRTCLGSGRSESVLVQELSPEAWWEELRGQAKHGLLPVSSFAL